MSRAIAIVTGSRAEYRLVYWLIRELQAAADVRLQLIVTGMHLQPEFGHTVDQIRADGLAIDAEVDTRVEDDSDWGVARSTGLGVLGMADAFKRLSPDLAVVLGDRFEILAAAQAAMLMKIPIAHIHGGEVTEGAIDESIRHAVSKMASLHFVSAEPYRRRLLRMGEDPARVHLVGAPGLDQFVRQPLASREELARATGLDAGRPFLLITYHPATRGALEPHAAVAALLDALDRFPDHQILMTKANADAGGRAVNDALARFAEARPGRAALVASLGSRLYLTAVREAAALVGNSSSGLIEAPAVNTPTVNVGPRQQGRLRAASVVDCDENAGAIEAAIRAVLEPRFKREAASQEPPYRTARRCREPHGARAARRRSRIAARQAFLRRRGGGLNMPRTFVIAEAGVNHNGALEMAHRLVDAAADAGADAVKFQTFRADRLASRNAPKAEYQVRETGGAQSQYEMLRALELSNDAHVALLEHCGRRGIEFMSSPFDEESLEFLVSLGVKRLKLGSGELTNAPLLLAAARSGLPAIISTGLATLAEVEEALGVLAFGMDPGSSEPSRAAFAAAWRSPAAAARVRECVTVLHCTTEYPSPAAEANLRAMATMREAFGVACGYSDHSVGATVSIAAVALGATTVEKHFTLDRTQPGPDHTASLEPAALSEFVRAIRSVEAALGDGVKAPVPAEIPNIAIARKSIVAATRIEKGERIAPSHLAVKRPGTGRSPFELWDVVGSIAGRAYEPDEPL